MQKKEYPIQTLYIKTPNAFIVVMPMNTYQKEHIPIDYCLLFPNDRFCYSLYAEQAFYQLVFGLHA